MKLTECSWKYTIIVQKYLDFKRWALYNLEYMRSTYRGCARSIKGGTKSGKKNEDHGW